MHYLTSYHSLPLFVYLTPSVATWLWVVDSSFHVLNSHWCFGAKTSFQCPLHLWYLGSLWCWWSTPLVFHHSIYLHFVQICSGTLPRTVFGIVLFSIFLLRLLEHFDRVTFTWVCHLSWIPLCCRFSTNL